MTAYRQNNKEKVAAQQRHRRYGVDEDTYNRLYVKQSGCCAICKMKPERSLNIDHCHETKVVRGLLCSSCNVALGHLKDSQEILMAALVYLNFPDLE